MSTKSKKQSYREGLRTLREDLKSNLPFAILDVFDNDAVQLKEKHKDILKIKPGEKAPEFTLNNAINEPITLSKRLSQNKVVLVFYRGTWCPYCNLQLNQYQQSLPELKALGAELIAISPQHPDASLSLKEKNELTFEVLSDPGNIVSKSYTTVFKNNAEAIKAMKTLDIDFYSFYADDTGELPVPAVFIIDQDQRVIFAKAESGDYRERTEIKEIIDFLKN